MGPPAKMSRSLSIAHTSQWSFTMSKDVASTAAPYEFDAAQSKVIGNLGGSMRIVGAMALVWAVVGLVTMCVTAWKSGVLLFDLNPILGLFIGLWAISSGTSFVKVAATQGNDIGHLMDALSKLRSIFSLIAILIVAALVITLALLIYFLVAHPEGASVVVGGHRVV
jgi:hypothetical protein